MIAAVIGATACTPAAPTAPTVVDVWFHAGQGGEREAMEAQARAFNTDSVDVQVDISLRPEGDYDAFVRRAGEDGQLPCLLDLDGPFLASYVEAGWLQPLDGLIDDEIQDDLLPSIREQGSVDDVLYGVGTFDSGLALWGNARYLDAVGARIPTGIDDAWTLDELEDILADLQRLPEVDHALDLKTNYAGEWFTYGMLPFVWDFGGDVLGPDGRAEGHLDGDEAVAAMRFLQDAVDAGWVDPRAETDDAFYGQQTAALSWVGHWMWSTHRDALGDDLLLLPAPRGPGGQHTGMGSWQWAITSSCEDPEAAASFLRFLLEPSEVLRMTSQNGAVPARDAALADSPDYGPAGPLRLLAEQLDEGVARPRPITPRYPQVTSVVADAVVDILRGADVEDRLDRAARELDEGTS